MPENVRFTATFYWQSCLYLAAVPHVTGEAVLLADFRVTGRTHLEQDPHVIDKVVLAAVSRVAA